MLRAVRFIGITLVGLLLFAPYYVGHATELGEVNGMEDAVMGPPSSLAVKAPRPSPFPEPETLRGAMDFWKSVFFRHETHQALLHDREHHIVWSVVELPTLEDGTLDRKSYSSALDDAIAALRLRLKRLAKDPAPLDDTDGALMLAAGGPDSPILKDAHSRIRSQRGIANNIREGVERAKKWFPKIHEILEAEGVPPEIAALPFVESGFNPRARSGAGAAGLWQLMPATARGLGLTVNRQRDDRLNVEKATRAAAKMLRQNYKMLGSWPLAITGYNHGPYGVKRAVKSVGSTDLVVLIDSYRKSTWGFASKNFYAEFLAVIEYLETDDEVGALALGWNIRPSTDSDTP